MLLAVHCSRVGDVLGQAGDLEGRIVVSCMLPMNAADTELVLVHMVAACNTVPNEVLCGVFEARGATSPPSLVYCGDKPAAKAVAATLARELGFAPVDGGPLPIAQYMEPFALLVAQPAYEDGGGPERAYRFERFGPSIGTRRRSRQQMEIRRNGSRPSGRGAAEYFTGTVRLDPLFEAPAPARAIGISVTFEPGARTAWHTHPLGQTLVVTAGRGLVQRWGGPVEEIRPGDVIWFPPGEKHWHGAAETTAMTHVAVHEHLDGTAVEWQEQVSDEQYRPR